MHSDFELSMVEDVSCLLDFKVKKIKDYTCDSQGILGGSKLHSTVVE